MVKTRLGFILPSGNTVLEPEVYTSLPAGVTAHFSRAYLERDDAEQLAALREHALRGVRELATADVDLVVFGCTTGSLIEGDGYDVRLIADLQRAGAPRATTTSTAVIEALRFLKVNTIALAAPYDTWLTQRVVEYLQGLGFEVVRSRCLGIMDRAQADVPSDDVFRLATEANDPRAEALFISCTNFPTRGVLTRLRAALGKPVFSSNSATLWHSLRLLGLDTGRPDDFAG